MPAFHILSLPSPSSVARISEWRRAKVEARDLPLASSRGGLGGTESPPEVEEILRFGALNSKET